PVGKSGPGTSFIIFFRFASGSSISVTVASIISFKLCGGMFVAMPTAMPLEPLTSKQGILVGRTVGSPVLSSKFGTKLTVSFSMSEHFLGDLREARFGIPHGGGRVAVDRAEVTLPVDKRIAHVEFLREADEGVVNRSVTVRMELAEDFADDLGALAVGLGRREAEFIHAVENAAMNGLQ